MKSLIIAVMVVAAGYLSYWLGCNYPNELEPFFYYWNRTFVPLVFVWIAYEVIERLRKEE